MLFIVIYIFRALSIIVNSDIFRHMVEYLEPCVTLAYSELCHIQNPGIVRTQDIFSANSVKVYSDIFRTLRNARILRTLPYSESCFLQNFGIFIFDIFTFRHIPAFSIMIIMITLVFFVSLYSYVLLYEI